MTTDLDRTEATDSMGPVDYLVVAFPTDRMTGEAFPMLVDLAERGIIRILDLAFVRKEHDGTVTSLSQVDLERMEVLEAALFDGAASGLLDLSDLSEAANALDPGTAAAVLVYENSWAAPFATALRRSGGQLVAAGHIPVPAILASLDALEGDDGGELGSSAAIPSPAGAADRAATPAEPVG
jgi:hypothetical protein